MKFVKLGLLILLTTQAFGSDLPPYTQCSLKSGPVSINPRNYGPPIFQTGALTMNTQKGTFTLESTYIFRSNGGEVKRKDLGRYRVLYDSLYSIGDNPSPNRGTSIELLSETMSVTNSDNQIIDSFSFPRTLGIIDLTDGLGALDRGPEIAVWVFGNYNDPIEIAGGPIMVKCGN